MSETEPIDTTVITTSAPGQPEFNSDDWRHHLNSDNPDDDTADEEAEKLLRILWDIAMKCVDIGWGDDVVQIFVDELEQMAQITGTDSVKLVEQNRNTQQFNQSVNTTNGQEE